MKNKVIYSKIHSESPNKQQQPRDCETPKLSQSQVSLSNHVNPGGNTAQKAESLQQRVRSLEEEGRILREENEYVKAANIQYCKLINVGY